MTNKVYEPAAGGDSKTTPLQQARANARLDNGRIQDSNGEVTTIRVWIQRKIAEGFAPTMVPVPDTATVNRLEKELAYLRKQWEPSGNPNWPSTKRFYAIKQLLAEGPMKAEYRLVNGDRVFTCTKTEYDYAVSLDPKIAPLANR